MSRKWETSVSVGILLENGRGRNYQQGDLLMARKKESGLWTVLGGGIEGSDTNPDAHALRELGEESGLKRSDLSCFEPFIVPVIYVPVGERTSVGVIYYGRTKEVIGEEGFAPPMNSEIDLVKPWRVRDLQKWVDGEREDLYKPGFNKRNLKLFIEWSVDVYRQADWLGVDMGSSRAHLGGFF